MSGSSDIERDVKVIGVRHLADDVVELELAHPYGLPLPGWEPGAHIDVILPLGERQYSMFGEVGAPTWKIGVLREQAGRGGSALIHDTVQVGDTLRVRGPRNHFTFSPDPSLSYLFLAGGIGITPLNSMISAARDAGVDYRIAYAGRSRDTMALVDELEADNPGRISLYPADEGRHLDLDTLVMALGPGTVIYCCGPTRLNDGITDAATGFALHLERFEARKFGEPVLHESFEVELALSGETLTVPPERSILEVVEEAGVLVLSSCREGTCGTCETVVLEGDVDHRDSILTPDEQAANDKMFICVSRSACPRLVLEL